MDHNDGEQADGATLEANQAVSDQALTLAAVAARVWCSDEPSGRFEALATAASWVMRARMAAAWPPLGLDALVECFGQPVDAWLPGAPAVALLDEDNQPSLDCEELVDEMASAGLHELQQAIVPKVRANLTRRADGPARYVEFRRFLIENAHATDSEAFNLAMAVGAAPTDIYQRIPSGAIVTVGGEGAFFPCPRCRWPMRARPHLVACGGSLGCSRLGSRFHRQIDGALVPLGELPAPTPIPVDGRMSVLPGLWRFTTQPGLEELELQRRLELIGAEVELWPDFDSYDLRVHRSSVTWKVDVKDHLRAAPLIRQLGSSPTPDTIWIVLPDRRSGLIPALRQGVPPDRGYRFTTATRFVELVGRAV